MARRSLQLENQNCFDFLSKLSVREFMDRIPAVLVIENGLFCQNLYKEALSSQNINVLMATEGATALNLLKNGLECSVIVTGYDLPDMNGLALLNETDKLSPGSTKIMVTARKEEEIQSVGSSEARIFRFMTKPIDVRQFIDTILSGINRYRQTMKIAR